MELTINQEDNLEKIEFDDMGFLSLCKPDFINRFLYFNGNYNALKAIDPIDTSYCSVYKPLLAAGLRWLALLVTLVYLDK